MREILLNNGFLLLWIISAVELVLTITLFSDFSRKRDPVIICMALVGVGLCYDAAVLTAGKMIMLPVLSVLSRGRFIVHGLFLPIIFAVCAHAVPFYKPARIATWVLTTLLMLVGAVSGFYRELEKVVLNEGEFSEIVRFTSASPRDSWMELVSTGIIFGTAAVLILSGIRITIKQKTPSIMLSGLLMLGFYLLGPLTGNTDLVFLISMFGGLSMLLCFVIFEKRHISKMYDYYH